MLKKTIIFNFFFYLKEIDFSVEHCYRKATHLATVCIKCYRYLKWLTRRLIRVFRMIKIGIQVKLDFIVDMWFILNTRRFLREYCEWRWVRLTPVACALTQPSSYGCNAARESGHRSISGFIEHIQMTLIWRTLFLLHPVHSLYLIHISLLLCSQLYPLPHFETVVAILSRASKGTSFIQFHYTKRCVAWHTKFTAKHETQHFINKLSLFRK